MGFRVAVASSDGIVVNSHFGMAENFYVFELDDGEIKLIDKREVLNDAKGCACGGEADAHKNTLLEKIKLINDCQYVLISRIGIGAENLLNDFGIAAYEIPGFIDESLGKLNSYVELDNLLSCR